MLKDSSHPPWSVRPRKQQDETEPAPVAHLPPGHCPSRPWRHQQRTEGSVATQAIQASVDLLGGGGLLLALQLQGLLLSPGLGLDGCGDLAMRRAHTPSWPSRASWARRSSHCSQPVQITVSRVPVGVRQPQAGKPLPSSSAADSALSPPKDLVGRIAEPAALASKDTAVDTWLRAPLCVGAEREMIYKVHAPIPHGTRPPSLTPYPVPATAA